MRGTAALLLLFLLTLAVHYSRWRASGTPEPLPAELFQGETTIVLPLGASQHFLDGNVWNRVMELTQVDRAVKQPPFVTASSPNTPWRARQQAENQQQKNVLPIERLTARQRLLLGEQLHPDQMSAADWESLPGIGPSLAAAIVADRQNNGDFQVFSALDRVKGVGPKKLARLRPYFEPPNAVGDK